MTFSNSDIVPIQYISQKVHSSELFAPSLYNFRKRCFKIILVEPLIRLFLLTLSVSCKTVPAPLPSPNTIHPSSQKVPKKTNVVLLSCGSYNPVTNMHLRMFELAREHLQIKGHYEVVKGITSPVGDGYNEKGLIEASHRVEMAKLAVENHSWIEVDSWESRQAEWLETVKVLRHHRQELLSQELDWHNEGLHTLRCALLNCRSLTDKTAFLNDLTVAKNLDMLLLVETWQKPEDNLHLNRLTPLGYSFLCKPRLTGRGGGLAVIHRDCVKTCLINPVLFAGAASGSSAPSLCTMPRSRSRAVQNHDGTSGSFVGISDHKLVEFSFSYPLPSELSMSMSVDASCLRDEPRLMLLCGADMLNSFVVPGLWKPEHIEEIIKNFGLVCITDDGSDLEAIIQGSDDLRPHFHNIHMVCESTVEESSADIRRMLQCGQTVQNLLPQPVLSYIRQRRLYTAENEQRNADVMSAPLQKHAGKHD
ncbi:nicotinamide/nicotinic acid mononucleotide adenylyltransferase 1-like [Paramormyrops kingsleyae]|uniref:nicotinamide/nicotinic acid mononucleotide adenylyltransferase 1-like n=1 Tax=Paramormyrops kingsleyae TaxID=1676925 RepID=UPI003B978D11